MRVLFSVTQRELLDARKDGSGTSGVGLVVQLRLADDSIYPEKGKIDFIDVTVNPQTDGQIVRAVFPNKNETLTDGMTVRVILEAEKPPTVVAISQAAISLDQAGSYVFVVNDKNVVEQRRVRTGPSRDGMLAIEDGLKAGDKVIIQGQQKVRPGMTVTATLAPPPPSMPQR
jgi:membrane fusion protein (multidrug efflux system)